MRPGRHRSETGPTRDSDETKALRLEMAKHIATMKFEQDAKRLEKTGASKEQILELSKKVDEFADYLYHTRSELLDKLAERNHRALGNMAGHAREAGSGVSLSNLGKQSLAKLGAEFKALLSDSGHSETGQRPATDSGRTTEPKTTRSAGDATPKRETGRTAPETRPVSEKKPAGSETTPSSTLKDTSDLRLLREAARSARVRAEATASSLQD